MVAKVLDNNKREPISSDDGDGNEKGKKAIGLYWQNNNFARASRFFVHFLAVVARLRHETYLHVKLNLLNFLFLFVNLDTILWDSTRNFANT